MINSKNYIEYIVDYYDKNLTESQTKELFSFLSQNKELYEEFLFYGASIKSTFEKEEIKSPAALNEKLKNIPNQETEPSDETFIAYIENDLDAESRIKFEKIISENADAKSKLNLFYSTKLEPENIIFPHKEKLIKKHTLNFRQLSYAASIAAIFIIALFLLPNNKSQNGLQLKKQTSSSAIKNISLQNNTISEKQPNLIAETHIIPVNHSAEVQKTIEKPSPIATLNSNKIENPYLQNVDFCMPQNEYLAIYEVIELKNSLIKENEETTKEGEENTKNEWREWGKDFLAGNSTLKDSPLDVEKIAKTGLSKLNQYASEKFMISQNN